MPDVWRDKRLRFDIKTFTEYFVSLETVLCNFFVEYPFKICTN